MTTVTLTRKEAEHAIKAPKCVCVKCLSMKLAFSTTVDTTLRIQVVPDGS